MMVNYDNMGELRMSFKQGMFFAAPETIVVNQTQFVRSREDSRTRNEYVFVGPRQQRIVAITLPRQFSDFEAPHEVAIAGRSFHRRFDKYYTPQDASPEEIVDFFDLIASEYETTIDLSLNRAVTKRMLETGLRFGQRRRIRKIEILDFGCGTGLTASVLATLHNQGQCRLTGCDISARMLDFCRVPYAKLLKSTYASVPIRPQSFDVIIAAFVAQYFVDLRPLLELTRILKPNGLLIFNLPRPDYADLSSPYRVRWELKQFRPDILIRRSEWKLTTTKVREIPIFKIYRLPSVRNAGDSVGRLPLAWDLER